VMVSNSGDLDEQSRHDQVNPFLYIDRGSLLAPERREIGMCSSARRMRALEDSRDVETENS